MLQEIRGKLGQQVYENAQYIYDRQQGYGSGRYGNRFSYYWTDDSLVEVRHHYETYFPLELQYDGLWFKGYTDPVTVYLIDGDEQSLTAYISGRALQYGWQEIPKPREVVGFLNSVQSGGTLIIYKYRVVFLIEPSQKLQCRLPPSLFPLNGA